jgi:hypothetical protein
MLGNRRGLALIETILFASSRERMNPLECMRTKTSNRDVEIGITVPLEKGAPVETSLLTNH